MIVQSTRTDDQKAALLRQFKRYMAVSGVYLLLMLSWLLYALVAKNSNGRVLSIVFLSLLALRVVTNSAFAARSDRILGKDGRWSRWLFNAGQFALLAFLFGMVLGWWPK